MNPLLPVVVLLAASTLWGLTWLPLKHFGAAGIGGVVVTLFGHGSVGLLSMAWLWRRRNRWRHRRRALSVQAALGATANLAFACAMLYGEVVRVMALFYLLPAWGVLGGRLLLGEAIDTRRWASVLLALAGAFFVLGAEHLLRSPPTWVDGLAVLAGMALAFNNVVFRMSQTVAVSDKLAVIFAGTLGLALTLVVLGVQEIPHGVAPLLWLEVVLFGVVWILLASLGTQWAVHHMEASRSSILILFELLTAVGSSTLLTADVPTTREVFGGCLIVLSAVLEGWRPAQAS